MARKNEGKKHLFGNIGLAIIGIMPIIPKWLANLGAYQTHVAVMTIVFLAAVGLGVYGTIKERSWTAHGTLVLAVLHIGLYLA